jgi:hypothetical protein
VKKTTALIQPLDAFLNKQMKVIPRGIYDRVMLDELDISMSERNNSIRLTSLNHNQLASETFHRRIPYAWYANGYTDTNRGPFKTVAEVCFSFSPSYLENSIPWEEIPEGSNSFQLFHTSSRSTYGQKMDSKLLEHLGRFPRQFYLTILSN